MKSINSHKKYSETVVILFHFQMTEAQQELSLLQYLKHLTVGIFFPANLTQCKSPKILIFLRSVIPLSHCLGSMSRQICLRLKSDSLIFLFQSPFFLCRAK